MGNSKVCCIFIIVILVISKTQDCFGNIKDGKMHIFCFKFKMYSNLTGVLGHSFCLLNGLEGEVFVYMNL